MAQSALRNLQRERMDARRARIGMEPFVPQEQTKTFGQGVSDWLGGLALATAPVPVVGDVTGGLADAAMYMNYPEQRTWTNAGLTLAGLIPIVPGAAGIKAVGNAAEGASNIAGSLPSASQSSAVPNVVTGQTISERFPTAKGATENPLTEMLRVDINTLMRSPEQTEKIARTVQPYTPTFGMRSPEKIIETMKNTSVDNLRFLYEQMPPEIRQEAALWYEGR